MRQEIICNLKENGAITNKSCGFHVHIDASPFDARTLRDLLYAPMEDVHLLHKDVEIEPSTIVVLSESTLTDAGKQAWADVLDAKVYRIYHGFCW